MPKPLLKPIEMQKATTLDLSARKTAVAAHDPVLLEKALRKRRSPAYMEALRKLFLTGAETDRAPFDEFASAMEKEFPELLDFSVPIGIIGQAVLVGPGRIVLGPHPVYDVATLSTAYDTGERGLVMNDALRFFRPGEAVPPDYAKARPLAASGDYWVEVYTKTLRALRFDGTVSVIPR